MMRSALNAIDAHSETTAMIGDRMDTDVVAGMDQAMADAVNLKFIAAPLTKEQLGELIKVPFK